MSLAYREAATRARVLVVGDVMLDRYWFGDVDRISPEAPVPVVKVEKSEERPGGAANVARNVAALSAPTTLLSVVGDDEPGATLKRMLEAGRYPRRPARGRRSSRPRSSCGWSAASSSCCASISRWPSHEVLNGKLSNFKSFAGRRRRGDPVRLRQGRPHPYRRNDPFISTGRFIGSADELLHKTRVIR